jgi:hypothetical protein
MAHNLLLPSNGYLLHVKLAFDIMIEMVGRHAIDPSTHRCHSATSS